MWTLKPPSHKSFSNPRRSLGKAGIVEFLDTWKSLSRVLLVGVFLSGTAFGDDGHDHDLPPIGPIKENAQTQTPKSNVASPGGGARPDSGGPGGSRARRPTGGGTGGCRVIPDTLADFANGERYDYSSMVTFLTDPQCAVVAPQVSQMAIASGVAFRDKSPFKLDSFARGLPKNSLESSKKLDLALKEMVPPLMRQNPLSTTEMLPLLGQLSLLSPSSARFALAKVIEQELYAGDGLLQASTGKGKAIAAGSLAATLVRLGAGESLIANEMAESVEDMALLAQADSLARYFRALSAAASVEASLVPTFNLTAGALNRGVQRGKGTYPTGATEGLVTSLFEAIRTAMSASAALEPGAAELNEAFGALLKGAPITAKELGRIWKEAVRVLAVSTSQTSLADVVSVSLTPEFMFLKPAQKEYLMQAARNYPQIAGSVQSTFLKSWDRMWTDLNAGRIPVAQFNRIKQQHFEPMTVSILELDPYLIDPKWLGEVVRRGMVKDDDIERRFPRFVLAFLDRRDRASKIATMETGLEPTVSSLAENFAVLWNLSQIHMPALSEWVRKNDAAQSAQAQPQREPASEVAVAPEVEQ